MVEITSTTPIAYFCAEYGIQANLPLYAGGLGILSGDIIKAADDQDLPFFGVGLLYRGERAIQEINQDGMQRDVDMKFDPVSAGLEHVYLDEQPVFIRVHLTEIDIWARVWKKTFDHQVVLYLLDTDTDQNQLSERSITHALYSGTEESLLKQQFILGIGGAKLINSLGVKPVIYHLNEGRPALLYWQLIREYMDMHGVDYAEASQRVKSKIVYTNHTLVAAGNNAVKVDLIKRYAQYYADKMGVSIERLLEPGIVPENPEIFSMTTFSLNISVRANGVSQLHTELSRKAWPQYNWQNITNGVHMSSWQDSGIVQAVPESDELWQRHLDKKKELESFIAQRTGFHFDPNRMIITWARRLAGYKRLDSLFEDIERLRTLLRNQERPVQLLVAGKAHVLDKHGKQKLQHIIKLMAKELSGHALFIPNYDLDVARYLVQGSDLWINVPEHGKEACGTSGMKALSNGVLQASVKDGWVHEVDLSNLGWELASDNVGQHIYSKLESEIIPLYYQRDEKGIPRQWLKKMSQSIKLSQQFTARKMLDKYQQLMYQV